MPVISGVNDVVFNTRWDYNGITGRKVVVFTVEYSLSFARLNPDKLIMVVVNFSTDFFPGF